MISQCELLIYSSLTRLILKQHYSVVVCDFVKNMIFRVFDRPTSRTSSCDFVYNDNIMFQDPAFEPFLHSI